MTAPIEPHRKRPDWFRIPFGSSEPLWGVPGSYFDDKLIIGHRTHLPLLDPTLAGPHLAPNSQPSAVWAERDARCAARGFKLRTVQHQAVDFARERRGVFLCDDPRIGKTLSALMMHDEWQRLYLARTKSAVWGPTPSWNVSSQRRLSTVPMVPAPYGPLLIVAPLSTRAVWLGWVRRLYPDTEIGVIKGRTFDAATLQKPIVFGHYDVIHKWLALVSAGTVILDEVHLLTNPKAQRTKAAAMLCARARHIVALTGTPINRFPPDMYAMLDLLAPGAWGSHYEFCQRYGDPVPTAHGTTYNGVSNERELKARLSEIMLRRLWRDCHTDLPPITRSVVVADLSQAERNKLDVLAGKLKAERANTAANLAAYRRVVSAIKLPTVVKEATRVLDRGLPVVIWAWHRDFAEEINKRLLADERPAWLIHGEVSIAEREQRMAAWKANPCGALIATMAVAGAGIDLSHARIAIVGEIDWTPATIGQVEMRTYDPSRAMDVLFVIANHVIDQRIVRSLVAKLSAADPLGVAAAIDAIEALRETVLGPEEDGDLDQLLADLLAAG